jgi:hypothetical protein
MAARSKRRRGGGGGGGEGEGGHCTSIPTTGTATHDAGGFHKGDTTISGSPGLGALKKPKKSSQAHGTRNHSNIAGHTPPRHLPWSALPLRAFSFSKMTKHASPSKKQGKEDTKIHPPRLSLRLAKQAAGRRAPRTGPYICGCGSTEYQVRKIAPWSLIRSAKAAFWQHNL